nr:contactin-3-like isoform X1 [Crassostrea gigas]
MDLIFCLDLLLTVFTCAIKGLDEQMPPKIMSLFNNEYFFPRETLTDALFTCKAQNGKILYKWNKDGNFVQNSQFVSLDNLSGTLKFVKMQNEDYGTYQCFATNDYGTSISKPFKVKESRLGSFPNGHIKVVPCTEHQHCKIECRDRPNCFPDSKCRVEWKIGEGTKTNVEINKRVVVDGKGNLHFLWTEQNDWTGQQYRCGLWQEQLKTLVVGSQTRLLINNTTAVSEREPVLVSKENGKALVGGNGVLRCIFSGYPLLDIEWVSPQKTVIRNTLNKYDITDFGRVLTIMKAEQKDEGVYYCKGKGKTGFSEQRVNFNVTSAPFLTGNNQMLDAVVTKGKDVSFRCEVKSLSTEMLPSRPLWKKNGKDLDISKEKYNIKKDNQVLTVTDVQKSDTGVYQCLSENSEGVLLKEAILKVIDPITIHESSRDSYKIVQGGMLKLAVVADTDPSLTLQYKWMFTDHQGNEKEIETNKYWSISRPVQNNLTIDLRQITDPSILFSLTGYYSVIVHHKYDQKRIYFTVRTDTMETDIITMEKDIITMETDIIPTTAVPQKPIDQHTYPDTIIYIVVSTETFIIIIEIIIIVSYLNRRKHGRFRYKDKKKVLSRYDMET